MHRIRAAAADRDGSKGDWTHVYFFFIAVAYKVPWTAISSLLGQFSVQFQQPRILLYLNLAYFVPSVPALLLLSSLQDRLDRKLGVAKAAMFRFIVGLGGLVLLCLCMPTFCSSPQLLLAATAAVGLCYSIAFGTSYQLVTHFPPACTVALSTGFVSCGAVVLLADLLLKRGPYYSPHALEHLFQAVALQTSLGLLAAAAVLRRHWRRLAATNPHTGLAAAAATAAAASSAAAAGQSLSAESAGGKAIIGLPVTNIWGLRPAGTGGLGLRHAHASQQQQQQQQAAAGQCAAALLSTDGSGVTAAQAGTCSSTSTSLADHQTATVAIHLSRDAYAGADLKDGKSKTCTGSNGSRRLRLLHRQAVAAVAPLLQLLRLAGKIWPAWLGLLLSVGSSMLAFPFFTFVPHTGAFGEHLPQVLFYARLLGDILGRLVPHWLHLRSSKAVVSAGTCKAALLLLLVPAMLRPELVGGDAALALLVAVNWWWSGYINTGAYLIAPKLAAADSGSSGRSATGPRLSDSVDRVSSGAGIKAKAGGLMAFCFQVSCFAGLMGAWALQSTLLGGWLHPAHTAAVVQHSQQQLQMHVLGKVGLETAAAVGNGMAATAAGRGVAAVSAAAAAAREQPVAVVGQQAGLLPAAQGGAAVGLHLGAAAADGARAVLASSVASQHTQ